MGIHKLNIKMYKVLIVALALAAPALATFPLILETTSTTAAGVSTVTGSTTLLSASAATGLFAAVGIGLLLREAARSKRSIESGPTTLGQESSFSIISQLEPAQCYRRLVCDVASGKMPADESDNVILA